jgi:hypothetical protein
MNTIQEQVRQLAYHFYCERGRTEGHEKEDWLRAEMEIKANKMNVSAGPSKTGIAAPPKNSGPKTLDKKKGKASTKPAYS